MPFRPVPGCPDWEVDSEITLDRRITFRLSEEGRLSWGKDAPMWKLKDRLEGFFDIEHFEFDRRIRKENGRLLISFSGSDGDFKLFCTPIDVSVFRAIKMH